MATQQVDEMMVKLGFDTSDAERANSQLHNIIDQINNAGKQTDQFKVTWNDAFMMLGAGFNELNASLHKLTDETKKVEDQAKATKEALSWGGIKDTIGGIAGKLVDAAKAAASWSYNGIKAIGEFKDLSERTGTSTDSLQRLAYIAPLVGMNLAGLSGATRILNRQLENIQYQGGKKASGGIALLGLEAKDLRDLAPEQQLIVIADRMRLLKSDTERMTTSLRIFGNVQGAKLMPLWNEGAAGIAKYAGQARIISAESVRNADDVEKQWTEFGQNMEGVKRTLFASLSPGIKAITGGLRDWSLASGDARASTSALIGTKLSQMLEAAAPEVIKIAEGMYKWVTANGALLASNMPGYIRSVKESFQDAYQWASSFVNVVTFLPGLAGKVAKAAVNDRLALERRLSGDSSLSPENQAKANEVLSERALSKARKGMDMANAAALDGALQLQVMNVLKTNADVQDEAIQKKMAAARKTLETPKAKKKKEDKTSKVTIDDVIGAILEGQDTSQLLGMAKLAPSSKDIKPTTAMDLYFFTITQHITAPSAVEAGKRSAEEIKSAFSSGRTGANFTGRNQIVR